MISTTYVTYVSHTLHEPSKTALGTKPDLIDEWKRLIEECNLFSLSRKSIRDALESVDKLSRYLDENLSYFIIDHKPALQNPISHFRKHFEVFDDYVKRKIISPDVATDLMYLNYLYDSVHQLLFVSTYQPHGTNDPSLRIEILNIPSKLFDWMFKLDYLLIGLYERKSLDKELFNELKTSAQKFLREALNLRIFLPISTHDIFTKYKKLFWSQEIRDSTRFKWLISYLYDRVHHERSQTEKD
ncbi:hypothetical protein [Archaeoglobus profundus]|uniref:Uncharacterized protein n=1 Tax=Archaeoglobus profundus (strain DSM 5631 / JCM 9629 / NBRC 100127 / Av18) TaxID=572546 RepID=D2RFB7_ARCPA|nr:hypothetical protein [Archaeoglobus profundus]ADB58811.1 hypothetical protein Arcpr_1767 [Archaeoglobus profundus DSM 5631]